MGEEFTFTSGLVVNMIVRRGLLVRPSLKRKKIMILLDNQVELKKPGVDDFSATYMKSGILLPRKLDIGSLPVALMTKAFAHHA